MIPLFVSVSAPSSSLSSWWWRCLHSVAVLVLLAASLGRLRLSCIEDAVFVSVDAWTSTSISPSPSTSTSTSTSALLLQQRQVQPVLPRRINQQHRNYNHYRHRNGQHVFSSSSSSSDTTIDVDVDVDVDDVVAIRDDADNSNSNSSSSSEKATRTMTRSSTSTSPSTTTSISISPSSSSDYSELDRAFEIAGITWNEFISPVGKGLFLDNNYNQNNQSKKKLNGFHLWKDDFEWDLFWELELQLMKNNINTANTTVAEQFTQYLERLGATYVKFGQALSSRPDIVPRSLAIALSKLQDDMDVLNTITTDDNRDNHFRLDTADGAREILRHEWTKSSNVNNSSSSSENRVNQGPFTNETDMECFLNTLSVKPVAAASIGVVYSGVLPSSMTTTMTGNGNGKSKGKGNKTKQRKVAIKIRRPNVRTTVDRDAKLLRSIATVVASIPKSNSKSGSGGLIQTNVTGAVEEFISRLYEELDYTNEVNNIELFSHLYSHRRAKPTKPASRRRRRIRRRRRSHQSPSEKKENVNEDNDDDNRDDGTSIVNSEIFTQHNHNIRVVVPNVYRQLCTEKVIVMEWIEGTKLIDLQRNQRRNVDQQQDQEQDQQLKKETFELINQGIDCTLSQLLETGIMHADPHGGNLLKVPLTTTVDRDSIADTGSYSSSAVDFIDSNSLLGYIDFGIVAKIPTQVQDGLICAVCQLVFANNVTAVGELFTELMLLPSEVINNPLELQALTTELQYTLANVLVFEKTNNNNNDLTIPTLKFDKLLEIVTRLVPRFQFQLPPYFLNNARALVTLEGMAREVDSQFNILHNLYPYAIQRLFSNPTSSQVVDNCLKQLTENKMTSKLDFQKIKKLLYDASYYSGYTKRKVIQDILQSKNGVQLIRRFIREQVQAVTSFLFGWVPWSKRRRRRRNIKNGNSSPSTSSSLLSLGRRSRRQRLRRLPLQFLDKVSDCLRL